MPLHQLLLTTPLSGTTPAAVPSHVRHPTEQQQEDDTVALFPAQSDSELDLEQVMDAISREIAREYRYFYGD